MRPLTDIGMRIFLIGNDDICRQRFVVSQVDMQVIFDTDCRIRSGELAHPTQQVALGIGIAFGNHRAV